MDSPLLLADSANFLDIWDSLPTSKSSNQSVFEMLDEDLAYIDQNGSSVIKDIMWNAPSQTTFDSIGSNSDFGSCLASPSISPSSAESLSDSYHAYSGDQSSYDHDTTNHTSETEYYDNLFYKKLGEEYGHDLSDLDLDLDLQSSQPDEQYDSCFSSPNSIDSCDQETNFLDDTDFNSDIDHFINNLKQNNYNGICVESAQIFSNQIASFDFGSPNMSSKTQSRSMLGAVPVQTRKNNRKSSGRTVTPCRGQSLIMRPTGHIQKPKAKPGPKTTSAVSMLTSRACIQTQINPTDSRKSNSQIKLSVKSRQAIRDSSSMLKSNSSATSLSLLSTQDAMLKGVSSLMSPPISSDSDESVSSAEDSREKTLLKKKRLSSGAGSACSGRSLSGNIITSIQPGVLSSVSTVGVIASSLSGQSPSQAQPNLPTNRPLKRREHNDSERKRRDHLRTAFDELKQKVPKLANSERKPARIMILAEAANYAREMAETEERNQQALSDALAEQRRLKQLLEHYAAHGLA